MKAFRKYLEKRKSAINFNLKKRRRSYTSSTFHILRVEIKKLNAFLDLINYCSNDFKRKKTYGPFKVIFQKAGKIREIYLEEVKLKKRFIHILPLSYINGLRKRRLKEQEAYFMLLNEKNLETLKESYKEIKSFLKDITKTKYGEYLNEKKNKVDSLLNTTIPDKTKLHELRKQLKTLNYNKKIRDSKKENKTSSKKNNLSKLLGNWLDNKVIVTNLEKSIKKPGASIKETNQVKKNKG